MARDDYHVIVYQILAYLYQCLKNGQDIDAALLEPESCLFHGINKRYWRYIMLNLYKDEMIEGITFADIDGDRYPVPVNLNDCQITPLGIEYLCDNSFMEKAKKFIKDVKEITPFM